MYFTSCPGERHQFSKEARGLWSFTQLAEGTHLLRCGMLTGF